MLPRARPREPRARSARRVLGLLPQCLSARLRHMHSWVRERFSARQVRRNPHRGAGHAGHAARDDGHSVRRWLLRSHPLGHRLHVHLRLELPHRGLLVPQAGRASRTGVEVYDVRPNREPLRGSFLWCVELSRPRRGRRGRSRRRHGEPRVWRQGRGLPDVACGRALDCHGGGSDRTVHFFCWRRRGSGFKC